MRNLNIFHFVVHLGLHLKRRSLFLCSALVTVRTVMGDKQLSKGTQDLLLSMMKDAGLNNRQRSMLVQHASGMTHLHAYTVITKI